MPYDAFIVFMNVMEDLEKRATQTLRQPERVLNAEPLAARLKRV